nr:MAG TPA: baseplate protein [Caudoviricetes sp.]
MNKTFDEAIAGIRKAERGVEVREDIAQGMEYVKQYAEEVTGQQQDALQAAQTATGAASTATKKAAAAAESESVAQTAAANADKSAQSASADAKKAGNFSASAEDSANRAAAIVSTDKTLSVEGAPADGKATGDAVKNIKLPIATATTLGGVKVGSGLTVDADGTLSADSALAAYPVGSIFQTVSRTSPAALFGGTWQEIAQNRGLMGASSAHAAGSTVEAGLPNITGTFMSNSLTDGGIEATGAFYVASLSKSKTALSYSTFETNGLGFNASLYNSIYGRSTTVQPAAYYVHIWRRVA